MSPVETLQLATVMMFALYALTALVGSRIFGGLKPALWFAASNTCRMAGVLIALANGAHPNLRFAGDIFIVAGLAMLHRSFAEQLDRPKLLWRLQMALVAVMATSELVLAWSPTSYPVLLLLVSSIVGVQAALTASALFSFSGEGVETAGRFAGASMLLYALFYLLRAVVVLRYDAPFYPERVAQTTLICLAGAMVSGAATTFGFVFIASGKQRLELLWRAQIDELTGLLNRWAFKRIAVKETFRCMRKQGQLAVLMMDLDGMKRVNDRLGHSCGDAVLQAVAARLQEALRDRDSIARMGGDEFCILLPDTDTTEAVIVAERLRADVDMLETRYRGEVVKVRASFGVSSSDQCGWSWQALVDESDAALYEAKRGGNVRVVAATGPGVEGSESAPVWAMQGIANERRRR